VVFRSIAIVTALSVASAAAAQTVADPQVSADALRQVRSFESVLRKAIETAGSQLGERARVAVPDVQLRFQADPYAQGIILPTGEGIVFMVEVPGIDAISAMLFEQLAKMAQQQPQPAAGARPVTGVVTSSPSTNLTALLTEPENAYRDLTHQALIDAMLDSAFTLPLKEGQTLTVSAGTLNPNPPNPLDPVLRRLYLTIKADDLLALRQNKITRDEAKTRIVEKRY
jgi:hypothetical protein